MAMKVIMVLLGLLAVSYAQGYQCLVGEQLRNDCGYSGITQGECEARGCCWGPLNTGEYPWCFYRDTRSCGNYAITSQQESPGLTRIFLQFQGTRCNFFGEEIQNLVVDVARESDSVLHVKIADASNERWEVPEDIIPRAGRAPTRDPSNPQYKFGYIANPFGFFVQRISNGDIIFNSSASTSSPQFRNLVFEDQYLEISTQLSAGGSIYGLGERKAELLLQNRRQYPFWTADELTPYMENNYGSHPFYLEHRNGKSHGVFLLNSNGMDIDYELGFLRYKVIGGVFDFYFFLGPSPGEVVSQYTEVVGRPYLIPYWSLGFHQCRWGYENIGQVREVVRRYRESDIPLETMWIDIDYMDGYRCWTFDPVNYPQAEMTKFVEELHNAHQKHILIVDPGIKNETGYSYFDLGNQMDIFLKTPQGDNFVGRVWPGNTAFPDFLHPRAYDYWRISIQDFLNAVDVDGLWVDMNEIANFCNGYCDNDKEAQTTKRALKGEKGKFDPNNPPYQINNRLEHQPLNFKTTDMDTLHYGGVLEYDAHNLYGTTEVIATKRALEEIKGKRAFVLSRSTFSGAGHHGGHWTGDNVSQWEDLYFSIAAILNMNIFGIPYIGADICGFYGDTTEELCARWMQLGAFYPFSRNHNHDGFLSQEPYNWDSVAKVSRIALGIRYSILPVYYTLFYQASSEGKTVARPLFFEFPNDPNVLAIDRQFMIGETFLLSPVLQQSAVTVDAYIPAGRWFDYYTLQYVDYPQGVRVTLQAPLEVIPIHIRGGSIYATLEPKYTTFETLQTDYTLTVALSSTGSAKGFFYLDDGESLNVGENQSTYVTFEATSSGSTGRLVSSGRYNYVASNKLSNIRIVGFASIPLSFALNGVPCKWTASGGVVVVETPTQAMTSPFTLTWSL